MLGFTSSREPVRGEVAREIREQLQRIATKSFNKQDKERMMMQNSSASYKRV
ncbi:MAG: hypothetical protein II844_07205 [Prevotella sp.]|nr:hypothetical protein [Prevotella sp.]